MTDTPTPAIQAPSPTPAEMMGMDPTEVAWAERDADLLGTGFLVHGQRVDPKAVVMVSGPADEPTVTTRADCGAEFVGDEHFHVAEPYERCDGKMGWHVRGSDSDFVAECPDKATAARVVAALNERWKCETREPALASLRRPVSAEPATPSPHADFIERRRRERQARTDTLDQQAKTIEHLRAELNQSRCGPDRDLITSWLAETLIESDEWSAMATDGDVMKPEAEVFFTASDAAKIIARSLQPIGTFNGGGSICVFVDPEGWKYPDLVLSGYRKAWDAAAKRAEEAASDVRP